MEKHWALLFMIGITQGIHIAVRERKSLETEIKTAQGETNGFNLTTGKYDLPYWNTVESNRKSKAVMKEAADYKRDSLSELTRNKRRVLPPTPLCRRRFYMINDRCIRQWSGNGLSPYRRYYNNDYYLQRWGRRYGCYCGLAKREEMIVSGTYAENDEYPWQVALVQTNTTILQCGGSLISDQWVLSAAHCTDGWSAYQIQALLGDHDRTSSHMKRIDIKMFVQHPDYGRRNHKNDFTLLKLMFYIDFNSIRNIRPICLPEYDNNDYANNYAKITGWGQIGGNQREPKLNSDILKEATVRVLSNSACKYDHEYESHKITDQMLCTYVQGGGEGFCTGDSGGPVITAGTGNGQVAGQNYELIGVVSWQTLDPGCASANYPGVNARVSKQLGWIREITNYKERTCPRVY